MGADPAGAEIYPLGDMVGEILGDIEVWVLAAVGFSACICFGPSE